MNADLDDLIDGYLDGSLDPLAWDRLNRNLAESADAREEFQSRMRLHGVLVDHFSNTSEGAAGFSAEHSDSGFRSESGVGKWLALAAAILVAAFVLSVFRGNVSTPVARITTSDTVGEEPLAEGFFSLEQGFAEIEMGGGARFAIEGGTEIELISADKIRLIRGSLGADVPERGRGFTVLTPGGEVVDLGTRFGVSVDESGETKAELFAGEIEVHGRSGMENFQGQAVVALSEEGNEIIRVNKAVRPHQFPMPELVEVIPIAYGSFEPGEVYEIGESTRDEIGVWGGNVARIVSATSGIVPFDGEGMLQLVSSSRETVASGRSFCDVLQWIDLRGYAFSEATLSARMRVNRVSGNEGTDTRFQLRVTPRTVAPTAMSPEERKKSSQLEWQVSNEADGDLSTWEELKLSAELTGETKFLQLTVGASENRENNSNPGEVEFDGHFIDLVELHLLIPARPSIR